MARSGILIFLVLVSLTGLYAIEKPPIVQVYAQHPPENGKLNVLNCYVTNFQPPLIEIELLKNGQKVNNLRMGDLSFTKDWSFTILAHAEFTPTETDKFACRVKHSTLKTPMTINWDPMM